MARPTPLKTLALAATLTAPSLLATLPGCGSEADRPVARTAEDAVGVRPKRETSTASQSTRDVTVVKDTKVIDNATGEVLKESKEETPVRITEQKKLTTDVKVDVGKTDATATSK